MSFAVIFSGLSKKVYTKSSLSVTVSTNLVQLYSSSHSAFVHRPACLTSSISMCCAPQTQHKQLLQQSLPSQLTIIRWANFFNKHSSNELWKGVISVSKYGAKKGRGRGTGKKLAKDLNRGQILGVGDVNMVWPGLNAPVVRGQEVVQRQLLEPDPTRQQRLQQLRDNLGQLRHKTVNPLERGWSGTKMGGRKMGLPDPIGDETFEGFETICLEFKVVCHMDGKLGRVRSTSVFCVAGNGNGLAGFGLAKAAKPQSAIRVAKNRAVQKLVHVPLYNGHTVLHDFYTQFGITKLFVHKMPEGYGLVCHRAIRAICEVIGIKDLHAQIEGSVHVQNLTKAFFLGLMRQKSYSQLATEKGLHVVETRAEQHNYPTVLASPVRTRTLDDIPPNENTDFTIHVLDGRVPLLKKKSEYFIKRTKGWETHLKKYMIFRNNHKVRKELIKAYGVPRSFLYDKYPECIRDYYASKKKVIEEDDD